MRAMTGLNRKAFEELLPGFTAAYQQSLVKPNKVRQRALGGGRKATLRTISEKLPLHLAVLQMLSHLRPAERLV